MIPRYAPESAGGRDGAPFDIRWCGFGQTPAQVGASGQNRAQPHVRIGRNQRNANRFTGYRRDIDLAIVAPIDLHVIGPRFNAVVLPKSKTAAMAANGVKPSPASNSGILSVSSNDPAASNLTVHQLHRIFSDAGDALAPAN